MSGSLDLGTGSRSSSLGLGVGARTPGSKPQPPWTSGGFVQSEVYIHYVDYIYIYIYY